MNQVHCPLGMLRAPVHSAPFSKQCVAFSVSGLSNLCHLWAGLSSRAAHHLTCSIKVETKRSDGMSFAGVVRSTVWAGARFGDKP